MQWQLGNDRFGMLISDILFWIFEFGCAVLAFPWQFQHFLLLNQFVCTLLLVLPPESVCPWPWNLLAMAAPGIRSHGSPCRRSVQGDCFGGFGIAGFHQVVFTEWEDTELVILALLSYTYCQYLNGFCWNDFVPSSSQSTKAHSVSAGVFAFLFPSLNRVNVTEPNFGCRDCVIE